MTRGQDFLLSEDYEAILSAGVVSAQFEIDGRDEDLSIWMECEALGEPIMMSRCAQYAFYEADGERPLVLVVHEGQPVGFYVDLGIWIDPDHRGKGLGPLAIVAAAERFGREAFFGIDKDPRHGVGFSEGGMACHERAREICTFAPRTSFGPGV